MVYKFSRNLKFAATLLPILFLFQSIHSVFGQPSVFPQGVFDLSKVSARDALYMNLLAQSAYNFGGKTEHELLLEANRARIGPAQIHPPIKDFFGFYHYYPPLFPPQYITSVGLPSHIMAQLPDPEGFHAGLPEAPNYDDYPVESLDHNGRVGSKFESPSAELSIPDEQELEFEKLPNFEQDEEFPSNRSKLPNPETQFGGLALPPDLPDTSETALTSSEKAILLEILTQSRDRNTGMPSKPSEFSKFLGENDQNLATLHKLDELIPFLNTEKIDFHSEDRLTTEKIFPDYQGLSLEEFIAQLPKTAFNENGEMPLLTKESDDQEKEKQFGIDYSDEDTRPEIIMNQLFIADYFRNYGHSPYPTLFRRCHKFPCRKPLLPIYPFTADGSTNFP